MLEKLFLEEIIKYKLIVLGFDEEERVKAWDLISVPQDPEKAVEKVDSDCQGKGNTFFGCAKVKLYELKEVVSKILQWI